MPSPLPIDAILSDIVAALSSSGSCIVAAPPGAGKTTRVPLAILASEVGRDGRIVMLEPRRLAARAAAERMASDLGEPVGETVGYRVRGETRVSGATRVEVVTEGILTRMIQSDPTLQGIAVLIFDEFHERSLNADLGLALALDVRNALRDDLKIVVMSATLDTGAVGSLLDAPVIISEGQAFPVETRWLPRPTRADLRLEAAMAGLIEEAAEATEGNLLAFLPGEKEIRDTADLLRLSPTFQIVPLFGAMDFRAQKAALSPPPLGRRNVVLATSIAETSLTLPDIRVVVDSGRARRARFDPASGMGRLVTERVTRAEADQRRGRAGRTAPGVCYRLWSKAEEGALHAFPLPEIATADLSALALELALWGTDGGDLAFLTPPPQTALTEARALLHDLGALDGSGRITAHGKILAALPVHPRVAHMLTLAGPQAASLAALFEDRDPVRGAGVSLSLRLAAIKGQADEAALNRIRAEARRLAALVRPIEARFDVGEMAALAYPDRIGQKRKQDGPADPARYVLSGGKGATIPSTDPVSREAMIVVTDLDGDPREARVRQAAPIEVESVRRLFADQTERKESVEWSRRDRRVVARTQERLGALVLAEHPLASPDPDAIALAALQGLRDMGLPRSDQILRLQARIALVRRDGGDLPDCSDEAILSDASALLPFLTRCRTEADLKSLDLIEVLRQRLGWSGLRLLDDLAPASFTTPLGRPLPIDYSADIPTISARLQEFFGVTEHPTVGPKRLPLRIALLSPAQRPVQVTTDLPGFWASSYADVRKDMRGQYPKHPWPEDPTTAEPTLRAKPRKV